MNESDISTAIIAAINALPNGRARKLHVGRHGGKGEPDIYGCVGGRMIVIETKIPGEKPRPLQEHILQQWRSAGALAIWATSVDDVLDILEARGIT